MKRYFAMSGDMEQVIKCKTAEEARSERDYYNNHLTKKELEDHAYVACFGEWDEEEDCPDFMIGYDEI